MCALHWYPDEEIASAHDKKCHDEDGSHPQLTYCDNNIKLGTL